MWRKFWDYLLYKMAGNLHHPSNYPAIKTALNSLLVAHHETQFLVILQSDSIDDSLLFVYTTTCGGCIMQIML